MKQAGSAGLGVTLLHFVTGILYWVVILVIAGVLIQLAMAMLVERKMSGKPGLLSSARSSIRRKAGRENASPAA